MTPHGTNANYARGCRCELCRQAHRDYSREHRRAQLYGHYSDPEDASGWTRRLSELTIAPMTLAEISRKTGVNVGTLADIRNGTTHTIAGKTAQKLHAFFDEGSA